ncbi:MAG TPA: BON domain-containing protein [Terracidiphilus sp.]|nr:BON domain-containing protein [Terracidiphilus sp.]
MKFHAPTWVIASISSLVLFVPLVLSQEQAANPDARQQAVLKLAEEVRRQIIRQPRYGVFDNIHFAIQGDTVILRGYASRPILKSDIENSVKGIEGVKNVKNEIEVLPPSPNDDRIRAAVYASIYRFGALERYTSNRGGASRMPSLARTAGGITNDPPMGWHAIRIIVRNGHVTLAGVVDSEADLAMAEMRANIVPGVFSVENELQVAGKGQDNS